MIVIKSNIINKSKNISIIYIALMIIFIATMIVSYMIPNKRINWHVSESIEQFKIEGVYPKPFFNTHAVQLDNFTDSWMLNLAMSADNENPITSALKNPHRVMEEYNQGKINKVENLEMSINSDDYETQSYSRYWHGYLSILRPLLVFFSYTEIRFINMCVLFLLFIIVNALMYKKLGIKIMVSFFISMIMVMFMIVPMSLQFSAIFYITFISMIVMLMYDKQIKGNNSAIYMFFIIGSITSFLDLLTVPLVTLGIPLITYILLIQNKDNNQNRNISRLAKSYKEVDILSNTIEIIKNSIIWAIGYGVTWASKWIIGSIILKENLLADALNQAASRTSNTSGETIISIKDVITSNSDVIYTDFILKIGLVVGIIWIIAMILYKRELEEIIKILPILLIAVMPFVWYIVLKNHSYMHFWFTYRNLSITTFAVLAFMSSSIDNKRIIK